MLSIWQHHTIFPDKFLGVLTIQFNQDKLHEGGELLNDEFTLSKRKPRDFVSGRIQLKVMYGVGAKVPKTVKMLPAEPKDPQAEDAPSHPTRPLRVSSKWGLSRMVNQNNSAFVVVEEDSDEDEPNKDEDKLSKEVKGLTMEDEPPKKSPGQKVKTEKSPRGPKGKKVGQRPNMEQDSDDDIDWNGNGRALGSGLRSGLNTKKTGLRTATGGPKRGSGVVAVPQKNDNSDSDSEEIDWNGSKAKGKGGSTARAPKRAAGGKATANEDSDSDTDSSSSSEEIDWNGTKGDGGAKNGGGAKATGRPKRTAKATKAVATANRTMNLQEQITEVLRLCAEEGSLIKLCERDGDNLTFEMMNLKEGIHSPMTLIFPTESVRTGEFLLFTVDGAIELGAPGSVFRAMAKVVEDYASNNNIKEFKPIFPKDIDTTGIDGDENEEDAGKKRVGKKGRNMLLESFHEVDFTGGGATLGDTSANVVRHTEEFTKLHGQGAFGIVKDAGKVTLRFAISPDSILSDLMAEIWQINNSKRIIIEILVISGTTLPPSISLYQTSDADLNTPALSTTTFGLMWYLQKRLERYLSKNWPPTASNHLFLDMITYTIDKISVCTKTCVICDTNLAFEMLKPSICDSALCTFSSEQYGLGQDVSAMLQYAPEVFDLLISSTAAICARALSRSADAERFAPFPGGVEVVDRVSNKSTGFLIKGSPNLALVSEVIGKLPSVADMAKYPNTAALRTALDKVHILAFPLLRWILTSNRTHLAKLKPSDHITSVPTSHQYLMLSATPARERVFQQRKATHGSFWAFHGSGFFNWHAILRTGLRNLSGTSMMSTGAVYGAGIYLAAESGTSMGYAQEAPGWALSSHGSRGDSYRCMALCEVINDGYKANPYYVIPKEEDIVTRYLFIFPPAEVSRMQSATLQANSISIPKSAFDQLLRAKKA